MSYSAAQLISISGFLQNQGLAVNSVLLSTLSNLEDTGTLSGKLHRVLNHASAGATVISTARTQIAGLCLAAPASYTTLPTKISATDVSGSVRGYANTFFRRGITGFLQIATSAASACQVSREILGSLYNLETRGFTGIDPSFSSQIDLSTGGFSSKFGPLAYGSQDYLKASGLYSGGASITQSATDIKRSLESVADSIAALGTLYDFQQLVELGTAAGLIKNLARQGLITTAIGTRLSQESINLENINQASPLVLASILADITGADLERIVKATNLKLPTNVVLSDGSDLIKSEKILTPGAISAIPGATLAALGKQLISLNVTVSDTNSLVSLFKNLQVPDHPYLAALNVPVPLADAAVLRSRVPGGTGDFNSCRIFDIIGTPSGYLHNDALIQLELLVAGLSPAAEAQALATAADNLYAVYVAGTAATATEAAFVAAVNTLTAVTAYQLTIVRANGYMVKIIDQIILELNNCQLAGIDLLGSYPGANTSALTGLNLTGLGADTSNIGTGDYFAMMATNDLYGDAVKSALLQGPNNQVLSTAGVNPVGIADIQSVAKSVAAQGGGGLTPQQRENVTAEARARNANIDAALTNAALYGYNNQYYVNLGYPSA
jgi:hypothetical protein